MARASEAGQTRGGVLIKLLLGVAVVLAACSLAWMLLLPVVVAKVVSSRTGFNLRVDSLAVNPFSASVKIKGLVLSNPSDFPISDFVHVRSFVVDAEPSSLWSDRIVIDRAELDVAEVALVKDKQGRSNAALFQERLAGPADAAPSPAQPQSSSKSKGFLIRQLDVRFDRLLMVDYSGGQPTTKEMNLDYRHTYRDVTSSVQIAVPILGRVTALGGTLGDFAGKLGDQARDAAKQASQQLRDTGKKAEKVIKGLFDSLSGRGK